MQSIKPQLTKEIEKHLGAREVWRAPAYRIENYRDLVEHIARLAYANRDQLLFFRGQDKDYQSKAGGSTLYPAIYRGDSVPHAEFDLRFQQLDAAAGALVELFEDWKIEGARDVSRKKYIQWSILQHYQVVDTPLLDLTHSVRVACSFAQIASTDVVCYVYVLGLPYTTNRISIHSEEDVVNIRLLSICPPAALRPYFQEGYMAGTPDITTNFDTKTEVDFRNRLIAKFAIPRTKHFWSSGFEATPKTALYPPADRVEELCQEIIVRTRKQRSVDTMGQLVVEWAQLEERLITRARQLTEKNVSVPEALDALVRAGQLPKNVATLLNQVRRIRNAAAHTPGKVEDASINRALRQLRDLVKRIPSITA